MSDLIERILPWYHPEEQTARTRRTNAVIARAQASLIRVAAIQERSADMVASYERAQEKLCRR